MANGLDGFIRAELVQKNVPLKVVLKVEEAHLILTGTTSDRKGAWHEGWLTMSKDQSSGSAMILDRTRKEILWAGEAGDRSLLWGGFARSGPRKVASRLVDAIKDSIVATAKELPPPPPLSDEERSALTQLGQQAPVVPASNAQKPLTNEDIIKLVGAGVSEEIIITRIQGSPSAFKLEPDDIVALKKAGVGDKTLAAMIDANKKK